MAERGRDRELIEAKRVARADVAFDKANPVEGGHFRIFGAVTE